MQQTGNKSDGEDEAETESSCLPSPSRSSAPNDAFNATETDTITKLASQFHSVLDDFRENWQRELNSDGKHNKNTIAHRSLSVDNSISSEYQAATLFEHAVELEQLGKVYDALRFYRRAVQLDPDIEFKAYEASIIPQKVDNNNKISSFNDVDTKKIDTDDEECNVITDDLYAKFQNDVARQGTLITSSRDAGVVVSELHISVLPTEIILYILRWVVSNQLDMRSLEQCSAVCKGLYLCARDEEIWKQVCLKVWGVNAGNLSGSSFTGWRQMFIERQRVQFNGCYISKTTYLRLGENSFQDQFYRPVQLVEYYRYIRFLPDGTVLMMTSTEEPVVGVTRLRNFNHMRPDILRGHYRLHGDMVTMMLKKNVRPPKTDNYYGKRRGSMAAATTDYDSNFSSYYIEFNIASTAKRKFSQLLWKNYSIIQVRNKREVSSEFELTTSKYPPLRFSCVRSYHLDADAPLQ